MVFTGSSNLAVGGESQNGDNMLAIYDPGVARLFATEAVRLVDHYYFRAAVSKATTVSPLILSPCGGQTKWWARDYDPENMRNVQRLLFADGPSAVTTIPSGVSDPSAGTLTPAKPAKTATKSKAPAKAPTTTAAKKAPAKAAKTAAKKSPAKTAKKTAARKTATKKKAAPKKAAKKSASKAKRPAKKAAKARG